MIFHYRLRFLFLRSAILLLILLASLQLTAQWQPAGDKIKTAWAEEIDPESVLNEYPRPILQREQWQNLNGIWDFGITPEGSAPPDSFSREILVPFAVESSLSGNMEEAGPGNELWYRRSFELDNSWDGSSILLHFGAVDWQCDVWVNGIKIGRHEGGYDPFKFDITPFLTENGSQEIQVRVWDPTSDGPQPRGKQTINPRGIWYTPVTGIWQTVWLEPVPESYVEHMKINPDIDHQVVRVSPGISNPQFGDVVKVEVLSEGRVLNSGMAAAGEEATVKVPQPHLWSPEDPFLYDLRVSLVRNGETIDQANSYMAMRKISRKKDSNGIWRIQLNNKNYFQFGTLDQGWWPDGLYTAPTDEALRYDIEQTKKYGFNMIRKHVKVEPARWYMHCDRIGMLVWQDMPNGDRTKSWQNRSYYEGEELQRSSKSEAVYKKEWKAIMDYLQPYPSIVTWVPFNEGWGQFKTMEIVEWTQEYDPERLVNAASGGNHFHVGDMIDLHNYPHPELYLSDGQRPVVLGEYGGIGLVIADHVWKADQNWGYVQYKTSEEATDTYVKYANDLAGLIPLGFSAAIYTQTTDVEMEVNGLMTYDRKVNKLDMDEVRKINQKVISALSD